MRRTQNQDSFFVDPGRALFIVADGMGGHRGGEIASRMAIDTIAGFLGRPATNPDPIVRLEAALKSANAAIQNKGQEDDSLQGMGTTVTALHFVGKKLYVGHVGDSRGYFLLPGRIWQITRDHSLVQEKLRAGLITRAQLKTDKMRNVITRSVGFENDVEVDVYELEPQPGDLYLLCSDGLSGMLDDEEILAIVDGISGGRTQLEPGVHQLIDAANRAGGDDNVTAVLVQVAG